MVKIQSAILKNAVYGYGMANEAGFNESAVPLDMVGCFRKQ